MAKLNIKKGDKVLVLTGKENGKISNVLECFPVENKVTVKGLNILVKHNKPKSAQDKGGIVKKEGKINASNLMVVCPVCNKATKVKNGTSEKGDKIRICKKCGASLDTGIKKVSTKKEVKKEIVKEEKVEDEAKKQTVQKAPTSKKLTLKDTKKMEANKSIKATRGSNTLKRSSNTAKKIGGK